MAATVVMARKLLSNKLRTLPLLIALLIALLIGLLPAFTFAASDWKATTGLSLTQTHSDNVALASVSPESAWITQVSPSLSLSRQGKRGSANLTYSLSELLYDSGRNSLTQALNASMQVEPVAGVFKLNGSAQVGQNYVSQFAATSLNSDTTNPNRVETRSLALTPSLHNELFDRSLITDASLGLNYASAGSGALASSTSDDLKLGLHSGSRPERLSYSANYRRNSAYGATTSTLTADNYNIGYALLSKTRVFLGGGNNGAQELSTLQGQGSHYTVAGATWFPTRTLTLTGTAGQSGGSPTSSLSASWTPTRRLMLAATSGRRNGSASYSLSGNWTPSVLTSLSGSAQKNFDAGTSGVDTVTNGLSTYGYTSYALNFSHRLRRSVVGLNYAESVMNASQQINQTSTFPFYLCNGQFQAIVSGQPMPAGCQPVSIAIPYTQLLNQTTYNKTWAGTLNFTLGRSALVFSLSQSRIQSLSNTSAAGSSRQTGVDANWSLPLSSRTAISLGTNWSNAEAAAQESDTWALYWMLTHQLSAHVSSGLSARHSEQHAASGAIEENRVSAQLGMTF